MDFAKNVRIESKLIHSGRLCGDRAGGPANRAGATDMQIRRQDDLIAQQAAQTKEHSQGINCQLELEVSSSCDSCTREARFH